MTSTAASSLTAEREPAVLVLEDGRIFRGESYGAVGETVGEAVFSTGMTGYQETLTDPSYHRQVVVMTSPHIGNTGVNDEDDESRRIWVAGYVVRDPALRPSNWRSQRTLEDDLSAQGVVGICGVDTRALTRHLRERGAMRVGVFSGDAAQARRQRAALRGAGRTADERRGPGSRGHHRGGLRRPRRGGEALHGRGARPRHQGDDPGSSWPSRGIEVHVLPCTATFEDIRAVGPRRRLLLQRPGRPRSLRARDRRVLREVLQARIPFFGICFGNQLLGRALGFGTYKLKYGHRGINQPVLDRSTGKVEVTAHNHGFAVDAPLDGPVPAPSDAASGTAYGRVRVSHVCLNDDVVEGLECLDIPAYSVQYHPEAAAGPHDAAYLFDRFVTLMQTSREERA